MYMNHDNSFMMYFSGTSAGLASMESTTMQLCCHIAAATAIKAALDNISMNTCEVSHVCLVFLLPDCCCLCSRRCSQQLCLLLLRCCSLCRGLLLLPAARQTGCRCCCRCGGCGGAAVEQQGHVQLRQWEVLPWVCGHDVSVLHNLRQQLRPAATSQQRQWHQPQHLL